MRSKTQTIRALDVVAIGPAMIWGAVVAGRHARTRGAKLLAAFLGVTGVATIIYNGINYIEGERIKAAQTGKPLDVVCGARSSGQYVVVSPTAKIGARSM